LSHVQGLVFIRENLAQPRGQVKNSADIETMRAHSYEWALIGEKAAGGDLTPGIRKRSNLHNIGSLRALCPLDNIEFDVFAFLEGFEPVPLKSRIMDKDVLPGL
jgi:hypothetical protein